MTGPKGLILIDSSQFPFIKEIIDLVTPHEGQGIPETFRTMHTVESSLFTMFNTVQDIPPKHPIRMIKCIL
jgi:hypothetical protein